eukprot:CAMPEP_0178442170 /NCGR_PEP_ID=MMETSP0689_2-20121128/37985_1 /TAXON_ID=160604 /ORGANISM="Amphidinium massartii, Strain CS-259" /LENGTH=172 /DNA_ID=CAMNT_0020065625 /DNA_START=102 /DNA_END=620 /DNA_ORIENTATION=+
MFLILMIQTIFCILRIMPVLDILGGFIMAIGIGVGWYAWREEMHITFLCYWGMMCLINGAFDLVHFIDFEVHRQDNMPMFSSQAPAVYNIFSAVLMLGPISQLSGAVFAWYFYKRYTSGDAEDEYANQRTSGRRSAYGREADDENLAFASTGGGRGSSFQAFQGSGQRLGST